MKRRTDEFLQRPPVHLHEKPRPFRTPPMRSLFAHTGLVPVQDAF